MNDALNKVEYPCGQTPETTFAAILQGKKSYSESRNAHSPSCKIKCNVQKELIGITAIRMYKDWPWPITCSCSLTSSWIVRWWKQAQVWGALSKANTGPSIILTCCSVKYWKEHGLWSLTDLDSNPSSATYWLCYFG